MMNEGPVVGATWQGEYLLQATLGDPSHGVFRAQRRRDSQPVALRVWRATNDALATEFLEHASAACSVRHPGLAHVEACGREEQFCFVVSEYIVGQKLDTWADQVGIPPLGDVIDMMRRLCDGLTLAARGGVTHSALHPRNLVIVQADPATGRRAQPKLLDLGVPQLARPRAPHPLAAQFMAPEQLVVVLDPSQPPLPSATTSMNVYSCGALLYYLCTGGPPHRQTDIAALREAQLHGRVVLPSRINPQITPSLNTVMVAALASDPLQRFPTVSDLGDALARVSLTPSVAMARPVLSSRPRTGSHPPPIAAGAARAIAVGRDRVPTPPPISVPPGIARRPPLAASEFDAEHETARTGRVSGISSRPPSLWETPEPEVAAAITAPPPRDSASVPAGSFSSVPPPLQMPPLKVPQPVIATPLALFSGAPHDKPEVQPIHLEPDSSQQSLITNDAITARPPRGERQRNPMMWFGVLAATVCAALFGVVRWLGSSSSNLDEQTPTVTVDRPALDAPAPAREPPPRAATAAPRQPPPSQPLAPSVVPPQEPAQPEHESANSRASSRSRSTSRTASTGASGSSRESKAPSIPSQSSATRDQPSDPEPTAAQHPEVVTAPNMVPNDPPVPIADASPQASKAATHATEVAPSVIFPQPSAAREPSKAPAPAENPRLPLEARASIGDVTFRGSLPTSSIRRSVERLNPQFSACYAHAAQSAGHNQFGAVTVEVEIDERGRARSPHARGGRLDGLNECVADAAGKVISERAPDTGTIHASFKVIFSP
jgi:hypothetical protein